MVEMAGYAMVLILLLSGTFWLIRRIPSFHYPGARIRSFLAFLLLFTGSCLYTLYYSGNEQLRVYSDVYKYYDDSYFVFEILKENPRNLIWLWNDQPPKGNLQLSSLYESTQHWSFVKKGFWDTGHRGIILFHAFLRIFSGGWLGFHIWVFALLSYLGILLMTKAMTVNNQGETNGSPLYLMIFAWPSVFLFLSPMQQESPAIFCIGFILFFSKRFEPLPFSFKQSLNPLLLTVSFLGLMYFFKPYFSLILLISLLPFYFNKLFKLQKVWVPYAIVVLLLIISGFTLLHLYPQASVFHHLDIRRSASLVIEQQLPADTYFKLEGSPNNVWMNVKALLTGLIRPFPWETGNLISLFFALELIIALALTLIAAFGNYRLKNLNLNWLLLLLTVYILNAWINGMTTVNFGTLIRYRALSFPFFILAILLVWQSARAKPIRSNSN